MTLSAEEFIRRFLLHVLPNGFRRIRYYGFLGNRHREEKLAVCRQLLGMPRSKRQRRTGAGNRLPRPLRRPHRPFAPPMSAMQQGHMVKIAVLPRAVAMPPRGINSS